MEKKFFKVRIETENGTVLRETVTDCVVAAINDVENDGIVGVYLTSCTFNIMANAFRVINQITKNAFDDEPLLKLLCEDDDDKSKMSSNKRLFRILNELAKK